MALHQCGLVHGPDPAIHVLLCVGAEVVRPHATVLGLRANQRILIVNVGAHSRVAGLRERQRYRRGTSSVTMYRGWTCM